MDDEERGTNAVSPSSFADDEATNDDDDGTMFITSSTVVDEDEDDDDDMFRFDRDAVMRALRGLGS